jgi:hypothetical protein
MAEHIAGRTDWDLATLELGINLIGSIDVDEFRRRVDRFVETIAAARRDKWIFCIDLFTCHHDFTDDPKIVAFRNVVREKVARLNLPRLVHVPGTDLLRSVQGLTQDLVHPAPSGMEEIAANLSVLIRRTTSA